MLSSPSTISLSSRILNHLADRIRSHRNQLRSWWRRLDAGRQALLASTADDLATAMDRIRQLAHAILDGTLIPIDRVADQRPYYSGKHERHGVNVQVITDAAGRLFWASPALPGSVRDLTAARTHGIIEALTSADVATFADKDSTHHVSTTARDVNLIGYVLCAVPGNGSDLRRVSQPGCTRCRTPRWCDVTTPSKSGLGELPGDAALVIPQTR